MPTKTQMTPEQRIRSLQRVISEILDELRTIRNDGSSAKTDVTKVTDFKGATKTADMAYKRLLDYADLLHETSIVTEISVSDQDKGNIVTCKRYYKEICSTAAYFQELECHQSQAPVAGTSQLNLTTSAFPKRAYLPKVTLPTFSGNLQDWPFYKDTYMSLVHSDQTISTMDKYHFLVGSLSGMAREVIKCVAFKETEYEKAWEILLEQFDNKKELAHTLVSDLLKFSAPKNKPSVDVIQAFLSTISVRIATLKSLSITNLSDYLLYDVTFRHLDEKTQEAFELEHADVDFPTFTILEGFLKKRHKALRNVPPSSKPPHLGPSLQPTKPVTPNKYMHAQKGATFVTSGNTPNCFICQGSHVINDCSTFAGLSPHERLNRLKGWPGCRNCLHPHHSTAKCLSKKRCLTCKRRHHSRLHLGTSLPSSGTTAKPAPSTSNTPSPISTQPDSAASPPGFKGASMANISRSPNVLLGTILATIQDRKGRNHQLRFLLDNGSQYSFLTLHSLHRLGMQPSPCDVNIAGVGEAQINNLHGYFNGSIFPCGSSKPANAISVDFIITPLITRCLPQVPVPVSIASQYYSYDLADPDFATPGPIHGLLGADIYQKIVLGAPICIHPTSPSLTNTIFGYVIMGQYPGSLSACATTQASSFFISGDHDLSNTIKQFWEIEEIQLSPPQSPDVIKAEQHFLQTHSRLPSGRYVVSLPFKTAPPELRSRAQALRRFTNIESQFVKSPLLKHHYNAFMHEYETLGHMKLATKSKFIIPHHAVVKPLASGDVKLRVVFDGSAKTPNGSLNQYLLPGPKLQADIVQVLLNFRQYPIAFTTDIVKMYRQIQVHEADQLYQTILWRGDPQNELQLYALTTVTYGLSCSPFLALRVLQQLVVDEGDIFPLASHAVKHHRFVDDIITGAYSIVEAQELKHQLIELLRTGQFELDKWASNEKTILPQEIKTENSIDFTAKLDYVGVLGLHWYPATDLFAYSVNLPEQRLCTKRTILSSICRLFDPLGYLGPVIITAKIFMQRLWSEKTGWDEPVNKTLETEWRQFFNQLASLAAIKIPRCVPYINSSDVQLVGFADASTKGYCAVIYLITGPANHKISHLFVSKSKVAPLKTLTTNRLELLGALLLANLYTSLQPVLETFNVHNAIFYTDSRTVLSWLNTEPHLLHTYVLHRVMDITEKTNRTQWYYVPTSENPADLGTRGIMPSQLIHQDLWWTGPKWLCSSSESWPSSRGILKQDDLPECRHAAAVLLATNDTSWDFDIWSERISNYNRCIRIIAFIQRFCKRTRQPKGQIKFGPITAEEFDQSLIQCVIWLQRKYYAEAFRSNSSPNILNHLNCFIDVQGVLRVGGRIKHSKLPYNARHQIILPKRSHFNNLLIDRIHVSTQHAGLTLVLADLLQNFWIPSAKRLIRQRIHTCMKCFRGGRILKPRIPIMGDLPVVRVDGVRAFHAVGVDFAGPFYCKQSERRNAPTTKAYLCLFICLAIKAVHMEIVPRLSTESFLDAFDRFISRRGLPATVYSDCGRNFLGASNYIKELDDWHLAVSTQEAIINAMAPRRIRWAFNPPYAPNFGGLWESNIKVAKSLFRFAIGNQRFTEGELSTIFTKIEAAMNSRPLGAVSSDPHDLDPLTPGHFLVGTSLNALPEPNFIETQTNHLSRWQHLRQITQKFWTRWQTEYLTSLQQRTKWKNHVPNLAEGDLVAVINQNLPCLQWPLGRITQIHPGPDGVVRVVTLKTSTGSCVRPVSKVLPLPIMQSGSSMR